MSELNLGNKNQVGISEEIQKFICSEIKTSVRELVGALNELYLFRVFITEFLICQR